MKKQWTGKGIVAVLLVALLGFGTYAFAGPGYGRGGDGKGRADCPRGMMDQEGRGWMGMNLTDAQKEGLEKERKAFFDATADLRRQIREKELALEAEMIKKEANLETAAAIQKEISGLEAAFDQQRLEHHFRMKQIVPEIGMGWGRNAGKGFFKGHRPCMR